MRPRIRTVKPEALKHEGLWDLGEKTGLPIFQAFVGLWCMADREGRFEWRPRTLKTDVLPYWDGDFEEVLNALEAEDFVRSYEAGGGVYGWIPTFLLHQVINQRESKSTFPAQPWESHKRDPSHIPRRTCMHVRARDPHMCCRCGSDHDLTLDHILPRSWGGTHHPDNLRLMCRSCSSGRPITRDALEKDLERDGFSLESLLSSATHVHARATHMRARGELEGNWKGTGRELELCSASRQERDASEPETTPKGDTQPDPAPEEPKAARKPRANAKALIGSWEPNPEAVTLARQLGLDPEREAATMRDWANANAARKADWDATFRNWLRNSASRTRFPPRAGGALHAAGITQGGYRGEDPKRVTTAAERFQRRAAQISEELEQEGLFTDQEVGT